MSTARRLGDLDPFSWIRDTRENILGENALRATTSRIGTDSKMAPPFQPFLQAKSEKPVEITISLQEINGERIISVELAREGNPPAKLNFKT